MKAILCLLIIPMLSFAPLELFFDFEYQTIDGVYKQMNEFEGKKIMVVILPATQTQDDLESLQTLETLSLKYSSTYTMIGVPSIEDDYTKEAADSLKVWYRSILHDQFVITAGMYTKKASPSQHPLFHWLTDKNQNMHFNEDVPGPGSMFFINQAGELYGVYSPYAILNDQLLNRLAL